MKVKVVWETEIDLTDTNLTGDDIVSQINEFLTTNVPVNLFWNYNETFGMVVRRTDVPFKVLSVKEVPPLVQRQTEITDEAIGC